MWETGRSSHLHDSIRSGAGAVETPQTDCGYESQCCATNFAQKLIFAAFGLANPPPEPYLTFT
jgi:hypothetical protein